MTPKRKYPFTENLEEVVYGLRTRKRRSQPVTRWWKGIPSSWKPGQGLQEVRSLDLWAEVANGWLSSLPGFISSWSLTFPLQPFTAMAPTGVPLPLCTLAHAVNSAWNILWYPPGFSHTIFLLKGISLKSLPSETLFELFYQVHHFIPWEDSVASACLYYLPVTWLCSVVQ